jgi:gamma-glutamyl-gamma-aminobutyraldehyde dehydrogenase
LAQVGAYEAADIDIAVISARRAFEAGHWSRCDPRDRGKVLKKLAKLLMGILPELALLECLDMGKLLRDAETLDVPSSAHVFRWYGEADDKLVDEQVDVRTPFGGYKQSGNGRDLSLHAFDKYTETKTTWIGL